jgi:hypothetical protein
MGYRSFTDSAGVAWQIWDVIPRYRHEQLERRRAPREGDTALIAEPEPSPGFDRRSGSREAAVPERMAAGWLCFEGAEEKRRLAPIPNNWERLTDQELEELCRTATRVEPLKRAVP